MKPMTDEQRAAVVAEAVTWIGTPYHHHGRVKGAGTDCAMILAEVYAKSLQLPKINVEYYPPQWHMHHDAERYLNELFKYGKEITTTPKPADIVTVKYGHTYSHGAIVVAWPVVVHAMLHHPVCYANADQDHFFFDKAGKMRPRRFFEVMVP